MYAPESNRKQLSEEWPGAEPLKTTLLVSSRHYGVLFRGRRKLKKLIEEKGVEVYVYDSCSLIDVDFGEALFYINTTLQLDDDTRRCIRRGLRKGSLVVLEVIPHSRVDIVLLNKLLSSYGIEYTWLKIYDSINNNGVPLNPLMDAYFPKYRIDNVIVEHAFHIRAFSAYHLIRGKNTATVIDPITQEALPVPSGENICAGAIVFSNGNPILYVFSGYVFSDTALGNEANLRLLFETMLK